MIVVVTGPSASGKTTWCRRHVPGGFVPEYGPTGAEPPAGDLERQAAFWCEVGCARWRDALRRERIAEPAVCDDDPVKLHYSWSLLRIGAISARAWAYEKDAHRAAIAAGRLGFADLILVSAPEEAELRRRRDADRSRRRRNFELHLRLRAPLLEWYAAVDRADPGRVCWELPAGGLPATLPPPRSRREDPALFDAVLAALP